MAGLIAAEGLAVRFGLTVAVLLVFCLGLMAEFPKAKSNVTTALTPDRGASYPGPVLSRAERVPAPTTTVPMPPKPLAGKTNESAAHRCASLVYTPASASRALTGEWCDPADPEGRTAVVLIHGGGEVGGSPADTELWRDRYLDAGIGTFAVEYTLGDAFSSSPIWPLPEQNIKAAIQFVRLRDRPNGAYRVVVHGFSAGARLAALALTTPNDSRFHGPELWPDESDAVDAATLFYGYYDGKTTWSGYFDNEPPAHASAINNAIEAAEIATPTMIVHGRQDFLVSELQSMRLSAALVEAGAPVDLHLLAGEVQHNIDGYGADALTKTGLDLVAPVLANASDPAPSAEAPTGHVLLIGDSIANETAPALRRLLRDRGATLHHITWPGIAPCDVQDVVQRHVEDPEAVAPDVVIILFTGNATTPCMAEANDVGSSEYFATYERDVATMVETLQPWLPEVLIPEGLPDENNDREQIAKTLAERLSRISGVRGSLPLSDLFTDNEATYATELPCVLPAEPCGEVRVRALDGGHLGESDAPWGRNRMAHAIVRFLSRQDWSR